MSAAAAGVGTWSVDLKPPAPGWFPVPADVSEQDAWRTAVVDRLREDWGDRWSPDVEAEVGRQIDVTLAVRAASVSQAMFQVWPIVGPVAAVVHVSIFESEDLPAWSELDAVTHRIDVPGLGPGIQCTATSSFEHDGRRVELASMHLVFDDGDTTLMLSIDETLPAILVRTLPGFQALPAAVSLERDDGSRFAPVPVPGILDVTPWPVGDAQAP